MKIFSFFICLFFITDLFSQSNCNLTYTTISLNAGFGCVQGNTGTAQTDTVLYGTCQDTVSKINWFSYTTIGTVNNITVTPGTLTNTQIIIFFDNCPENGGMFQNCYTANGSTILSTSITTNIGTNVWIGILNNHGTEGTYKLCVNSTHPNQSGSNCTNAMTICDTSAFTIFPLLPNSSGQTPACFGSATQTDVWIKFSIIQDGILSWKALPTANNVEFDWGLWRIDGGCPGTLVCCNYNYAGGSYLGFGMQDISGNGTCNETSFNYDEIKEFSPTINVLSGEAYAIQASNYDNNINGFKLTWPGNTCGISNDGCMTGVQNKNKEVDFIFPNPSNGNRFYLKNINELNLNNPVEIFNSLGQIILRVYISNESLEINLLPGLYFVKLSTTKGIQIEKLIVN